MSAAFLAAVLIASTSATVMAQSRLGATDGLGPLAPPPPAPLPTTLESIDRQYSQRADLMAARLLEQARKDRSEHQDEIAQRLLETLIARFPETASADAARRELFVIYAANAHIAGETGRRAPGAAASPAGGAASPPAPQLRASAPSPAIAPWRTTVVNARRLQDELRNSVGDRVFFGAATAGLGSRARAVVEAQAAWLLARPGVTAIIEGHADDAPAGADNDRISGERAAAVRDRLVAEGVEAERLQIEVRGTRDPVAVCEDAACAAQNRRVVLQVGVRRSHSGGELAIPAPRGPWPGDLRR